MRFYPKIRAAALTAVTVTALVGGSLSAPAQAEVDSGRFLNYSAPNGSISSQYHVYADGLDWAQPVGVVFYFDGDYWNSNKSNVYNPDSNTMQQMAQIANEKNMVFVPVISPDKDSSGDGITWWQNIGENGDFSVASRRSSLRIPVLILLKCGRWATPAGPSSLPMS